MATTTVSVTRVLPVSNRWPAIGMLALGLLVVYAVGFLPMPFAHNATHDARHANGFPCH